jgi:hypothetical protein
MPHTHKHVYTHAQHTVHTYTHGTHTQGRPTCAHMCILVNTCTHMRSHTICAQTRAHSHMCTHSHVRPAHPSHTGCERRLQAAFVPAALQRIYSPLPSLRLQLAHLQVLPLPALTSHFRSIQLTHFVDFVSLKPKYLLCLKILFPYSKSPKNKNHAPTQEERKARVCCLHHVLFQEWGPEKRGDAYKIPSKIWSCYKRKKLRIKIRYWVKLSSRHPTTY